MLNFDYTEIDNIFVIMANSYVSPLNSLDELNSYLEGLGVKGEIYIDLLMSNGFSDNRFFRINFNGKKLELDSLVNVEKVSKEILNKIYAYLQKKPEILQRSILQEEEKLLITEGLLISD